MKKILLLALSMIMILCLFTACGQESTDVKTVIMGLESGFAPLEFLGDDGKVVGVDPDIGLEIAKDMGVTLKIEDMNFDSLIGALETGKIDMIASGMSVTEERKKNVDFSLPYYEAKQVIVVKKDNTTIKSPEDLVGKTIAVQESTTGDLEAEAIEGVTMDRYKKYTDAITTLKQGKADAVVMDSAPAEAFVAKNDDIMILDQELVTEEYAIAVKKGNTELLESINKTITRLKDSGELVKIKAKYENE